MRKIFSTLLLFVVLLPCLQACSTKQQFPKPLIGISTSFPDGFSRVSSPYCDAIMAAGGIPVSIPANDTWLVDIVDGLLMIGGEDVAPERYGQIPIGDCVKVNAARDTSDFALVEAAIRHNIPILAICRGSQLVNVALGGTLIQDIPSQVDSPLIHRNGTKDKLHTILIEPGTRCHGMTGCDTLMVNSSHHQAVDRAGHGLVISARSSDGIVEMYESLPESRLDIIGIQSHPETFAREGEQPYLAIYQDFVNRCRTRKQ